jgi:hypothetical protein
MKGTPFPRPDSGCQYLAFEAPSTCGTPAASLGLDVVKPFI